MNVLLHISCLKIVYVKPSVHPKMQIWSYFSLSHVALSSVEHKT